MRMGIHKIHLGEERHISIHEDFDVQRFHWQINEPFSLNHSSWVGKEIVDTCCGFAGDPKCDGYPTDIEAERAARQREIEIKRLRAQAAGQ